MTLIFCRFKITVPKTVRKLIALVENDRGHDDCANINWDELGFELLQTDYMYIMKCSGDGKFPQGEVIRYGNVELSPSAGVLNYGQVRILAFR